MSKKFANLALAILLAAVWTLAALQGRVVNRLRDTEMFYYWVVGTANQYRLDSTLEGSETSETIRKNDIAFFEKLNTQLEEILPEIPLTDEDRKAETVNSKLVRIVRDAVGEGGKVQKPAELRMIWDALNGSTLAGLRNEFLERSAATDDATRLSSVSSRVTYVEFQKAGGNLANLFFGFRKVAANFMWLQVDRFYHQGMSQRMYPLMLTCVKLDPHFIDAFLLGAWHLAYNATAHMQDTPERLKTCYPEYKLRLGPKELFYHRAIDFLKDGIDSNPWNYKLYFDLGYGIYERKLEDHERAVKYLSEAIRYRHDRWVPRMLYRSMQLNGQYDDAIAGWQDYLKKFPDNTVAPRSIAINTGLREEKLAEAAVEKARGFADSAVAAQTEADELATRIAEVQAQGNAEEVERLTAEMTGKQDAAQSARAEADEAYSVATLHFNEALKVYTGLNRQEEDPFAVARILWIRAKGFIETGRFLEAISLLDNARWQNPQLWDDASKLIIETKQKAGIELTLSEKLSLEREKDEKDFLASVPPCE